MSKGGPIGSEILEVGHLNRIKKFNPTIFGHTHTIWNQKVLK